MKKYQKCVALVVVLGLVLAFAPSASAVSAVTDGKININTAAADELQQLDQIGARTAARIIEFRKANGPFKSPEDLMKVKGVGEKIFQKNKNRISI